MLEMQKASTPTAEDCRGSEGLAPQEHSPPQLRIYFITLHQFVFFTIPLKQALLMLSVCKLQGLNNPFASALSG